MRFGDCHFVPAVTISLVMSISGTLWPSESLSFAGLSARTTLKAVQQRYPHSTFVGNRLYVSETDARDHIYAIELYPEPPRRIRIVFERNHQGRQSYPRCEQIIATIRKEHGEPASVQEFREERSKNRRLTWRRGKEDLSLLCFRMGAQPLFAAELTITTDP